MKDAGREPRSRLADVLRQEGPPFQNWLSEVALRVGVLLTTIAQLSELVVSKCPKCQKADSVLWLRVGDHRVCHRMQQPMTDEPLPPFM